MVAKVLGYKARFCDAACRDGFKCDREHGLNYGLHTFNGVICQHREEWSLVTLRCALCGKPVAGHVSRVLQTKFGGRARLSMFDPPELA